MTTPQQRCGGDSIEWIALQRARPAATSLSSSNRARFRHTTAPAPITGAPFSREHRFSTCTAGAKTHTHLDAERRDILLLELAGEMALHERGLADTAIADKDELELRHLHGDKSVWGARKRTASSLDGEMSGCERASARER
jgi:hypothetical protein